MLSQDYSYDSLNRLQDVHDGTNWKQQYEYDRYGNRKIHQTNTTIAGIVKYDFAVSTANNRLYGPGETEQNHPTMNYDAAGNQSKDIYSGGGR
jgi:YD repeat-containing protein